jgi:acid phosphatase
VVLVLLENASYSDVIGSTSMPYLNSLAQKYALATNYYANFHPSIGNYFMLTSGQGITNDDSFNGPLPQSVDNVVRELTAAGRTWKSYAESLPNVGYIGGDNGAYLHRHNPLSYYYDVVNNPTQQANLVPFTQFAVDLATNALPNYSFVVPNIYDDAHTCPANMSNCTLNDRLKIADTWLQTNIAPLVSNANFQKAGLLVIAFDEAETSDTTNGGGRVPAVLVSPQLKLAYQSTTLYQHPSLERFTMELLGVTTIPGAGTNAPDMSEFLP